MKLLDWLSAPEVIGDPECPILHRWTVWPIGYESQGARMNDGRGETPEQHLEREKRTPVKLMVHHFLPNADDRDVHDHPRPFWTFVLKGGYKDMKPCPFCRGALVAEGGAPWCDGTCDGSGVVLNEHMTRGMIRLRSAHHRHRTRVDPTGCWTIVVMGPWRRYWGFWRASKWYEFREYGRIFGFGMRCD